MSQKTGSSIFCRAVAVSALMLSFSFVIVFETPAALTDPIPAQFFGHHGMGFGSNGIPTPAKPYGLFRIWDHWGCGNVGWAGIEPSKGNFSWRSMDAVIDSLKTKNVDILYCFGKTTPLWAAARETDPPTNIRDWDDFLTVFINRYHTNIKYLEVWNEAMEGENFYTGTIPQLVNLAKHLDSIANVIDPTIKILTPDATGGAYNMTKFYGDYFTAGGGAYADIVAFHGYCSGAGMNSVTPAEEILGIVTALKGAMTSHSVGSKPIWNTEASWGSTTNAPTADDRVAFLARHYLLQWSAGVSMYAWYCWDNNNGNDQWGQLWNQSGGISPAGIAYRELYNWMVGATMSQAHSVSGTVYTCGFTRPGGYQALAVWNTNGNSTYTVPNGYTRSRDLAGNSTNVSGTVSIGKKPILLESQAATSISNARVNTAVAAPALARGVVALFNARGQMVIQGNGTESAGSDIHRQDLIRGVYLMRVQKAGQAASNHVVYLP